MSKTSTEMVHHMLCIETQIKDVSKFSTDVVHHAKYRQTSRCHRSLQKWSTMQMWSIMLSIQTSRCHRSLQKWSIMLSIKTHIKEMSKISTEMVHHILCIQTNIKMSKISTEMVHHAKYRQTSRRCQRSPRK